MLNVKQAISAANNAAKDLFDSENAIDWQLEEVEFDEAEQMWNITLGFSVLNQNPLKGIGAALAGDRQYIRKYKVFKVNAFGEVTSIKIRAL